MDEAVSITCIPNGPLRVTGNFVVKDSQGKDFDVAGRTTISLCRCGQSSKRPFCDGTHKTCGFISDEAPTPPAVA